MPSDDAEADRQIETAIDLLRHAYSETDPRVLDTCIDLYITALDATPPDHPYRDRGALLSNLGLAYRFRYQHKGSFHDLDCAVLATEDAVEVTGPDHPERENSLFNLAELYLTRYENTGNSEDLDRACDVTEEGMESIAEDHPKWLTRAMTTARAHQIRYDHAGSRNDLDITCRLYTQAAEVAPADHPYRTVVLGNLGMVYHQRHEHTGAIADLRQAQAAIEEVITTTHQAAYLSTLGNIHSAWYEHTGALEDLERAVTAFEQAITASPVDDPNRAAVLSNLSIAYNERYSRTADLADLRQAVAVGEMAIAAAPRAHPAMARFLLNLGAAYQGLFRETGQVAELDQAISVYEQAVAARSGNVIDELMALANLGVAYQQRHRRTGKPADLERAITLTQQAVSTTPADFPLRARYLSNLAGVCLARFEATGALVGRQELSTMAGQVTTTASPTDRVQACTALGVLAHAIGEHAIAIKALDEAVALLPSVTPQESGWTDQDLIVEAVSVHCAVNDPAGAVVAAESVRRIADTELAHVQPRLAARFQSVRERLNAPNQADHRSQLWTEYDSLLTEIRRVPGFERFLLPPALTELQSAVSGGAAVLVNAGTRRSDAIIVTASEEPKLVPLPSLTMADVESHARPLLANDLGQLPETLGWLRATIAEPVLDVLPGNRVWWLPTGLLGLLPLHAAALEVVSSYVPTLLALDHARVRPLTTEQRHVITTLWPLDDTIGAVATDEFNRTGTTAQALHEVTLGLRDAHPDRPDIWAALIHSGP